MEGFKKVEQKQVSERQRDIGEIMQAVVQEAEKLEIKAEDRNEQGELLVSPDGPISHLGQQNELWWKIARTETFKNFFGDWQNDPGSSSKIVDKNGEPIVLFRGMKGEIGLSDFYNKESYYGTDSQTGRVSLGRGGIYTTTMPDVARQFGEQTYPFFANARRPQHPNHIEAFIDEMKDLKNQLAFLVSKNLLKDPQVPISQNEKYDAYVGERDITISGTSKDVENVYEILFKDPNQLLVIPNPIEKPDKSVTT